MIINVVINMHFLLPIIMICRVGNIRKRGVIWITVKIGKIIVISHITQEMSTQTKKNKQTSKQIKRKKKILN